MVMCLFGVFFWIVVVNECEIFGSFILKIVEVFVVCGWMFKVKYFFVE